MSTHTKHPAPLASAIYEGVVRHRRMAPREHEFSFPLSMIFLDLSEIRVVFSMTRWWSAASAAPVRFRRRDYLDDSVLPLDDAVRTKVRQELGFSPIGPIRLLTHLRHFGYCFNPVSFYYCFDESGSNVQAIVADITNVPWGERHAYVLDRRDAAASGNMLRWKFDKAFHVSPFMPMKIEYDWAFDTPGDELLVHMNLRPNAASRLSVDSPESKPGSRAKVFDATLQLRRNELTPARMRGEVFRYPLMTARVISRIHFEALRLWLKRVPIQPHPGTIAGQNAHQQTMKLARSQEAPR